MNTVTPTSGWLPSADVTLPTTVPTGSCAESAGAVIVAAAAAPSAVAQAIRIHRADHMYRTCT
jgi:hypothetical protein